MSGNSFGHLLRLTTFGESHGPCLGGVLDGCPAGIPLTEAHIQAQLDQRRPCGRHGTAGLASTARCEADKVQLLSGVLDGQTTGTSIGFSIANTDQQSKDYSALASVFRPGHADWTYYQKYKGIRDARGGGRASGRETAARVVGGAIAARILATRGMSILAAAIEMDGLAVPPAEQDMHAAASRPFFAASEAIVPLWQERLRQVRREGDSVGGIVQIVASGLPAGLGQPVFDKLDALLAHGLMSVGAVKGVEVGAGFAAARLRGSVNNDPLMPLAKPQGTKASPTAPLAPAALAACVGFAGNHAGGITGGISTGQDIVLRAAVKPIPSIAQEQSSVDVYGQPVRLTVSGRHDCCAIPRIVPVLSAMTALVLADALLMHEHCTL